MSRSTVRQALAAVLTPEWISLLPPEAWTIVEMPNDDPLTDWTSLTKVPIPKGQDWMAVVLMTASKDQFLCWGVVQVAPLILHGEGGYADLDYTQCARAGLRRTNPPQSFNVDYAAPPILPTRLFNLDELDTLLKARLAQYKCPTDACLVGSDEDRALDRLSFCMAAAAVARYRGLHPSRKGDRNSSLEHWIRGEQRIALHRFRIAHIAYGVPGYRRFDDDLLPPEYRGFGGPDVLQATDLLPLAHKPGVAILHRGHLLISPAHALVLLPRVLGHQEGVLRDIAQSGRFPSFRDHPHLMDILETFHSQLRDWDAPVVVPPKKTPRQSPLTLGADGKPILASANLNELETVMPACIKPLADRAFLPGTPHLKYEDRCILYGFVLANGVPSVVLEQRALAKLATVPGYDTKQISMQVKETGKYVRTPKFGVGWGCKKLQDTGRCPWYHKPPGGGGEDETKMARSNARVACHQDQLNRANMRTDPNPKWSIYAPVVFAQDLKRMLLASQSK